MYLSLFIFLLFSSSSEQDNEEVVTGNIVGYLKCSEVENRNNILVGIFIISENMDSLLTFNLPLSISNLDTSQIDYGIGYYNGGSIEFNFEYTDKNDLKIFDCPFENAMNPPSFFPIENFVQTNVNNAQKVN